MSNDTVNLTVTPEQAELLKTLLSLAPDTQAPAREASCGMPTQAGHPCRNLAKTCRHHTIQQASRKQAREQGVTPKTKTKPVQVEVTAGNRVTRASIAKLRELGVTATGKRSLEVVTRRAKVAGIEIEPVPFGTLS